MRRSLLALSLALAPACASSPNQPPPPPAATGGTTTTPPTGGTGGTVASPDAEAPPPIADAASTLPDAAYTPSGDGAPSAADAGGAGIHAGMTKMDDGMTLTNWEGDPKLWSVADGSLQGMGNTNGALLVSKADYSDFRIIFQTRMTANVNKKGHLGVCFWGKRTTPAGGYGGCKLLIPPQGGSWDYAGSGGLPGISHPQMGAFAVEEWHQIELICHRAAGTCRMATDGVEIEAYQEPKPDRLLNGPIGLQIHAGISTVQYKDVWIDGAPADDELRTKKP